MTVTEYPHSSHYGGFHAQVEDGRLIGVRPFAHDPEPAPMLDAIPEAVYGKTRVERPMVREGWFRDGPSGGGEGRGREPFVPVDWETALDLVAGELARVREEFGNEAIFGGSQGWSSAGKFHHARTQVRRFMNAFGGCTDQCMNYSFGAAMVFVPHIMGSMDTVTGPLSPWTLIAKHTKLMVLFGGTNPKNGLVNSGGAGQHTFNGSLQRVSDAGVRFVNVSPMADDTPSHFNAEWLAIRPNTDTALMLALTHTLVAEDLHDREFLDRYCTGFDRVLPYLMGEADGCAKDACWAATITGIDADTIRALARDMAATRTMVTAAWSLQRADHGEQPLWALILLASALGQIGLPGGGFGFGYGSSPALAEHPPSFGVPGMKLDPNPLGPGVPAARVTDCLLNPGETIDFNGRRITFPDIKIIYWGGGNPFHHHQDLNRLRRGWRRPETVIVHEPWWTATARHADIVLPATTTLERNDIGSSPRDRFVFAMHKAIEPVGEARNDFDILCDLARRLGCEEAFAEGLNEMGWLRHMWEESRERARTNRGAMPDFESFWRDGHFEVPPAEGDGNLHGEFRGDPDGRPLKTPSGKIELYSERIASFGYDDCPGHAVWIAPAEWLGSEKTVQYPLHMLSSQPRSRLHSQMDPASVSRAAKVAGREPVVINPDDAAARGIADGDVVRIFNDRGACLAGAVVGDHARPGVVRLSAGAWFDPLDEDGGSLEVHGNPNTLTLDKGTSSLGQGPSATTTLVEIKRFDGEVPPVTVFEAPATAAESKE